MTSDKQRPSAHKTDQFPLFWLNRLHQVHSPPHFEDMSSHFLFSFQDRKKKLEVKVKFSKTGVPAIFFVLKSTFHIPSLMRFTDKKNPKKPLHLPALLLVDRDPLSGCPCSKRTEEVSLIEQL